MEETDVVLKSRYSLLEWTSFGWEKLNMSFTRGTVRLSSDNHVRHCCTVDGFTKVYSDELDHLQRVFYIDFGGGKIWKLTASSTEQRNLWVQRICEYVYQYKKIMEFENKMILDTWNGTPLYKVYHKKTRQYYAMFLVSSSCEKAEEYQVPADAKYIQFDAELHAYWEIEPDDLDSGAGGETSLS